jgi:uncharacterized protein (DUF58 family)
MSNQSYLDPVVLARISSLQLRAKTVAEGFISGLHHTPFRGQSLEFAEHREYAIGDEPKYIDWKVYGKTDRFFVKQFEQDTNLRLFILMDTSGSMQFKGAKSALSKYDYGATLAGCLSYLTLRQGDLVGLGYSHKENIKLIPPRNSPTHLSVLMEALETGKPEGAGKLFNALETLSHASKKRSLVVLISDLLEEPEPILKALKFLKFKKHEVMVLHLLDREEKDFPYTGSVQFKSLENQPSITLDTESFRKEYQRAVDGFIRQYSTALRNASIEYYFHTTDTPPDKILRQVLSV